MVSQQYFRFHSVVANAPDKILIVDPNGIITYHIYILISPTIAFLTLITYANSHFVEQQNSEKLINTDLADWFDDGSFKEHLKKVFSSKQNQKLEAKFVSSNVWYNINIGYHNESSAIVVINGIHLLLIKTILYVYLLLQLTLLIYH